MAKYTYEDENGIRHEADQSMSDDHYCYIDKYFSVFYYKKPEGIKVSKIKRVITGGSGFILKGTGFPGKDYKDK